MLAPVCTLAREMHIGFGMKLLNIYTGIKRKILHCLWVNVNQDLRGPCETLRGKNHIVNRGRWENTIQHSLFFLLPAGGLKNCAYDIVLDLGSFQLQIP